MNAVGAVTKSSVQEDSETPLNGHSAILSEFTP